MKRIFFLNFIAIYFSFSPLSFATVSPSLRSCNVLKTWASAAPASEICSKNGGSFCATVKNNGQGICYGMGGNFCATVNNTGQGICYGLGGNMCSIVKNRAQGICYGLGESLCSTLNEKKDYEWINKLTLLCNLEFSKDFLD